LEGEQQRAGRHRYENQYWHCPRNVDDETLLRCSDGCGWVRCSCGSCLCDMPLQKRLERPHTVKIRYITDAVSHCPACEGVCFTRYVSSPAQYMRCSRCGGKGYQSLRDIVA
jgi:hypothetical protein